jgi:predicted HAD superfamily phosphohydrolase YqeG
METAASEASSFYRTGDGHHHHDHLQGIDAIFFDLDNTLVQTRAVDERACNEVCSFISFFFNMLSCLLSLVVVEY